MDKRVIAYYIADAELAAAQRVLTNAATTESYVVGDTDETGVADLIGLGLLVDEVDTAARPATTAAVRGRLGDERGRPGWRPGRAEDSAPAEPGVPTQWLLTLGGPLLESIRTAVEDAGARLEEYVPTNGYVVTATPEQANTLINLPDVLDLVRYGAEVTGPVAFGAAPPAQAAPGRAGRPEDAGQPVEPATEAATTAWDLWLTDAEATRGVLRWLDEHAVAVIGSGERRIRLRLVPESPAAAGIATLPGVLSMVEHVPPKLFNDVAGALLGARTEQAALPFHGAGQIVAVADTGLDDSHPDFQGRIVGLVGLGRPGDTSDPNGHGTHVAGSLAGDGAASGGRYTGIADQARLYFQSLLDPRGGLGGLPVALADLFEPAYQAGARIHNNSWGAPTASAYTVDCNDVDEYVARRRDMLIVIAAGNEGTAADALHAKTGFVDWLSLGSPASCKNALTVGAARSSRTSGGLAGQTYGEVWPDKFADRPVAAATISGDAETMAAFSSRGPCDDRRIKPDLVAPGTDIVSAKSKDARAFWGLVADNEHYAYLGGTSMACPLVAGCAALVREYYTSRRDWGPSAALLKATLVNGTRWLSGADSVADWDRLPNYHQGFGAVYLPTTVPSPAVPDLCLEFVDSWQQPALQFARSGARFRFAVNVAAGLPLRICLAYTDAPGRGLQNDVSLIVQDPDGVKLPGNADLPDKLNRSDADNNVEVVRVAGPTGGRYLIQVFARNLLRPQQDFALVVTGRLTSALSRVAG